MTGILWADDDHDDRQVAAARLPSLELDGRPG
jgi:hypothetical protein